MARRRRRRNPVLGGFAVPLAVIAVAGVGAFFVLKKKPRLALTDGSGTFSPTPVITSPGFTTTEGILPGDCVLVVNGQGGFSVPGIPQGDATPFKVGAVSTRTVIAMSLDPRAPKDQAFTVPAAAIIGSGDCAVGFA